MSKIKTLRSTFPGAEWKASFVTALMRLRPDMNPDAADEVSDSVFASSQAMQPETAAHHWATAQDPQSVDRSRRA